MSGGYVIHRLNTGWLYSTDTVSLLGGGRRIDVPGGVIRPYGWRKSIAQPNGEAAPGTMVPAPAWLILGGEKTILIDSGTGTAEQLRAMQRRAGASWTVDVTPDMHILARLQALGLQAEDIDILVQTHLHFDHIGGMDLFPKARIIAHAAELPWALDPPPYLPGFYAVDYSHHVRNALGRLEIVQSDLPVAPGVTLRHTGGHSPGHCIVLVDTGHGRVAIAGDAVYNYRNLEYRHPQGPFTDLPAVIRSMNTLLEADVIALNHDPLFDWLFPDGCIGASALAPRTARYMQRLKTSDAFPPSAYAHATSPDDI